MKTDNAPQNTQAALRKAAILVSALDTRGADTLLSRMGSEQAARVRSAVMQLGDVNRNEQRQVLDEFMLAGNASPRNDDPGIELDDSLTQKLASSEQEYRAAASTEPAEADAVPFRFLHETTADSLAKHLQGEHPQLVAVVVAHLPPKRAADLVQRLAPPVQANVLRRVAELDTTDPQVLQDVEYELKLLLSDDLRAARNRSAGLTAVTSIINAAGAERAELLNNVTRHDQLLAVQLGEMARNRLDKKQAAAAPDSKQAPPNSPQPQATVTAGVSEARQDNAIPETDPAQKPTHEPPAIAFEALLRLDDQSLANLIREADPQVILLALVGADPRLLDRIRRQLAPREARLLRRKLEETGPLRLADIERAQQQVAHTAAELAATGQLRLPQPKRFAVAA